MHHTLDQSAEASQRGERGRLLALAALVLAFLGALALRLPNLDAYGTHADLSPNPSPAGEGSLKRPLAFSPFPADLTPNPSPEGEGGRATALVTSPFPAGKGVGGLGPVLTDLALALGVGLATLACAALLWNPVLMWDQVIGLHAVQQDEVPWMIGDSLERLWPTLLIEEPGPLLLAALGGAMAL